MEFPEYARPGQDLRHRRRIETTAALADAVIVGSAATRDALQPYLDRGGQRPSVLVSPFGIDLPVLAADGPPLPDAPYFVCVGTIEPRKNHLLLLHLWRRLAEEGGAPAPRLVLIGHRGWETGNAVEMLDRCPALRGLVVERNQAADTEMARLLKGARALLLPSFAEGFGFPMVEALALGVPVLCSDLAALRENGGEVPEYLDPLDARAWRDAILDYSPDASPRRQAQLAPPRRLEGDRVAGPFCRGRRAARPNRGASREDPITLGSARAPRRAGDTSATTPFCRDGGQPRPDRSVRRPPGGSLREAPARCP